MYKAKYYSIKELVHPSFLGTNPDTLWKIFDERLLKMADKIRDKYGPCTVNANGLTDCGLRRMDSGTGASFSAHKFGRALDLHIRSIELEAGKIPDPTMRKKFKIKEYNKVRENLMINHEFDILNFEHGIHWLHVDTFNRDKRLFNP
jgi:hypothetical protein